MTAVRHPQKLTVDKGLLTERRFVLIARDANSNALYLGPRLTRNGRAYVLRRANGKVVSWNRAEGGYERSWPKPSPAGEWKFLRGYDEQGKILA